jgi:alpha-tubulin suppressor-like RCC1 family protein
MRRAALVGLLIATGCSGDRTEVVARFYVDVPLSARAHGLRFQAFDGDGTSVYDQTRPIGTAAPGTAEPLPFPVAVVLTPAGAVRHFSAAATLLDADGTEITTIAFDADYVEGERRELALCFEQACVASDCARCENNTCVSTTMATMPFGRAVPPPACLTGVLDGGGRDGGHPDGAVPDAGSADADIADGSPPCTCECSTDRCVDGRCEPVGTVSEVTTGVNHTCAILDGRAFCWGDNAYGKLGIGVFGGNRDTPQDVGLTGVNHISGADTHTCASSEGGVYCWGQRNEGRLAVVDGRDAASPLRTEGDLGTAPWIVRSGNDHSCAFEGNTIRCWGVNDDGQITGTFSATYPVYPRVTGVDWASVDTGGRFTCATSDTGELYCWGSNDDGALANASLSLGSSTARPQLSDSSMRFIALGLGGSHGCGISSAGQLYCWGNDSDGQAAGAGRSPTSVSTETDWSRVRAGESHTCGIRSGQLSCWGANARGQLGSPGGDTPDPREVVGTTPWSDVEGGAAHTCAITTDGRLYCWGANDVGQSAGSSPLDVVTPRRVCFP